MFNKISYLVVIASFLSACSTADSDIPVNPEVINLPVAENQVPGTVNSVYVERQFNQVVVPGQLDPEAVYYRPAHEQIIEIRPGRSQVVQYPEDSDASKLRDRTRSGR